MEGLTKKISDMSLSAISETQSHPQATGLFFNARMTEHGGPKDHPEGPERIKFIYKRLREKGIVARCIEFKGREVTREEIELVHSTTQWDNVHQWELEEKYIEEEEDGGGSDDDVGGKSRDIAAAKSEDDPMDCSSPSYPSSVNNPSSSLPSPSFTPPSQDKVSQHSNNLEQVKLGTPATNTSSSSLQRSHSSVAESGNPPVTQLQKRSVSTGPSTSAIASSHSSSSPSSTSSSTSTGRPTTFSSTAAPAVTSPPLLSTSPGALSYSTVVATGAPAPLSLSGPISSQATTATTTLPATNPSSTSSGPTEVGKVNGSNGAKKKKKNVKSFLEIFDMYYCQKSPFAARLSAGTVLDAVTRVSRKELKNAACVVRPPGHHAEADKTMGFCFFNNAAVAARYATDKLRMKRVAILDFDVHHGNGIQNIFYDDPRVLYISIHRFDNGTFYPSEPDAGHSYIGKGYGKGFNVNIPWDGKGYGDSDYIYAMETIVRPILEEFRPELSIISAGFDASKGDPLGGMKVSPYGFAYMTHMMCDVTGMTWKVEGESDTKKRYGESVVLLLEGGYNCDAISRGFEACTRVLLGEEPNCAPLPSHLKGRGMEGNTEKRQTRSKEKVNYSVMTGKKSGKSAASSKAPMVNNVKCAPPPGIALQPIQPETKGKVELVRKALSPHWRCLVE